MRRPPAEQLLNPTAGNFRRWVPSVGLAGCVVLMICFQSTLAQATGLRVDLTTWVVVFLALEYELRSGLVHALVFGYLSDLFSGEAVGLLAFTATAVFLALRLVVFRVVGSGWLIVTAIGFLATATAMTIRLLVRDVFGPPELHLAGALDSVPSNLFGALVLTYPVYRALRAIDRRLRPRD